MGGSPPSQPSLKPDCTLSFCSWIEVAGCFSPPIGYTISRRYAAVFSRRETLLPPTTRRQPHYEKYPPSFCPGRSNGSLGFNAKGPPGRPGAPLVGNISGLARARGPGPMSPRCLAQIVTPACKLSTLRHRSGGGCHPALTPIWNSMWVVIG